MDKKLKLDNQENDALRKAFGRRLREIRGFDETQRQFAEKLGITQSIPSRLEKGYTSPPIKHFG